MPHERAEVSVLEVLRQQLAGELVRLVNRELRAPLGPRHDVVASRVVHHVVPASERGWESVSGAPSRDENRAVTRRADRKRKLYSTFRDARTHTFRRKGGAASPVLDPIAPGGTSFAEPTPSGAAPRVARGAVRANRSRTRDSKNHSQRGNDPTAKLSIRFSRKKCHRRWRRKTRPRGPRDRIRELFAIPLRRRALRSADNRPARRFGAAHRTRERAPRAPPDPRLRASILAASRDIPRETRCASP